MTSASPVGSGDSNIGRIHQNASPPSSPKVGGAKIPRDVKVKAAASLPIQQAGANSSPQAAYSKKTIPPVKSCHRKKT